MPQRAKLKDIAKALNISITTVSRALNNKADINALTKERVLAKAKEIDYKPNNLAVSLRKSSTLNVVGVIIPDVKHNFFSKMLQGIMEQAQDLNYFVLVGESHHNSDREKKLIDDFSDYGVSGILLAPSKHSDFDKNLLPIIHKRIPVVVVDRMYDNYEGNFVNCNDFDGAYRATQHLLECGYKTIAHIGSSDSWSIGHERLKGYRAAIKDHGLILDENYIHICNFNNKEEGAEEGYKACHRLFSLKHPPSAIFSVTDDIAVGVYQYAKEKGMDIPRDLGIVGFSNAEVSQYLNPPLTTMEQFAQDMGREAVQYFYKALSANGQVFQKSFNPHLVLRSSTINLN